MLIGANCTRGAQAGHSWLMQLISGKQESGCEVWVTGCLAELRSTCMTQQRNSATGLNFWSDAFTGVLSMMHIYLQLSPRWRVTHLPGREQSDRKQGSLLFLLQHQRATFCSQVEILIQYVHSSAHRRQNICCGLNPFHRIFWNVHFRRRPRILRCCFSLQAFMALLDGFHSCCEIFVI